MEYQGRRSGGVETIMIDHPAYHILKMDEEAEKARTELQAKYRIALLQNPIGYKVLQDILNDLGFGMDIDPNNIAANALRNYAWRLLEKIGAEAVPVQREETPRLDLDTTR